MSFNCVAITGSQNTGLHSVAISDDCSVYMYVAGQNEIQIKGLFI